MKIKGIRIGISFFGLLMLASLAISSSRLSLAALLAAALHELGHILMARLSGQPISELKIGIFGAAASIKTPISSYGAEIAVALAGPLVNLLCALLTLPFIFQSGEIIKMFFASSLFLGVLNLLPISDFDGGRIFFCLLALCIPVYAAKRMLDASSFVFVFSLWTLSVYLLLRLGASLSLFVFSAAVFCKIFIKENG